MIAEFTFKYQSIVKEVYTDHPTKKQEDGKPEKVSHVEWVVDPDQYKRLREVLPDLPVDPTKPEDGYWYSIFHKSVVADLDMVLPITAELDIKRVVVVKKGNFEDVDLMVEKLTTKLYTLNSRLERYNKQLFNQKVNVHVPGNALLDINEVHYETDLCTDTVADHLSDGWKILAVCPQPDQRRPDYVFGKHDPDKED